MGSLRAMGALVAVDAYGFVHDCLRGSAADGSQVGSQHGCVAAPPPRRQRRAGQCQLGVHWLLLAWIRGVINAAGKTGSRVEQHAAVPDAAEAIAGRSWTAPANDCWTG